MQLTIITLPHLWYMLFITISSYVFIVVYSHLRYHSAANTCLSGKRMSSKSYNFCIIPRIFILIKADMYFNVKYNYITYPLQWKPRTAWLQRVIVHPEDMMDANDTVFYAYAMISNVCDFMVRFPNGATMLQWDWNNITPNNKRTALRNITIRSHI